MAPRKKRVRPWAVLAGSASLCACGLVESFDGYVGGPTGVGLDAGVTDGSDLDSTALDAGASAGDGSTAADGGAGLSYCASLAVKPTFCADFDEGLDVGSGFTKTVINPTMSSGSQKIDTGLFVSAPGSALLSTDAGVGSGLLSLLVYQLATTPQTSVHLTFKVKVETMDPAAGLLLGQIAMTQVNGSYGVTLYQRASGATVQEQIIVDGGAQSYPEYSIGAGVLPGQGWADADILVDLQNRKVIVSYANAGLNRPMDPSGQPGVTTVDVGAGYYSGGNVQASAVHLDNVAITAR